MKKALASLRTLVWAAGLGGLATLLAGPIAVHLFGPLVLKLVQEPTGSTWDPIIGGLSLTVAGAGVVGVLGRVVQLPPVVAGMGVGAMGTLWMTLLALMSGGPQEVWSLGLLFRAGLAVVAGLVAAGVARVGMKVPTPTPTSHPEKS